ncbi:cyclic nucleotide-binding domain-containing protein [Brevibacillus brevis]|uniref:cyclic nucleotide-binding domain-containing protein n=1 Tax=Brevibacillus brevis TaxID=1393 RepID=UPI0025A52B20|nr:cyclic nucleotide-binding domain-containing protein [Brevibacillus brevis]WJQ82930.1 cyclic nucleotide-binding domain-containing protein [Brevibacillus brevis]
MSEQIVLAKKTVFQTPTDTRMGIFFIQKGLLRLSRLNEEGKSFTVGLLGPGAVFGEIEEMVLGSRAVYIEAYAKNDPYSLECDSDGRNAESMSTKPERNDVAVVKTIGGTRGEDGKAGLGIG